jgi:hypothetical protein
MLRVTARAQPIHLRRRRLLQLDQDIEAIGDTRQGDGAVTERVHDFH